MLQNGCRRYILSVYSSRCFQQASTPSFRKSSLKYSLQRAGTPNILRTFTSIPPASVTEATLPLVKSAQTLAADQDIGVGYDTIYALSTGGGKAGIAVVRISGPGCIQIYNALCPAKSPPKARYATVRMLRDPSDPTIILDSSALTLYFPSPNTVTGEDVLELHIHGGPATVKAVLSAIPKCSPHTRIAEPGEFTRRAFENGRLDLAQVEALSDTLAAETEQQRRAAVRGHSQKLGQTYDGWREQLTYARGELEALIDFSEDQHFDESPAELLGNVAKQVRDMVGSINQHEHASHRGDLLRRGVEIALIGPPNTGKSSLLNLVVGREASIVSSEAGTTRDIVEVRYDIGGYLCTFADTAGLRISTARTAEVMNEHGSSIVGDIEKEGIKRAKARAQDSDLIIVLASIEVQEGVEERQLFVHFDPESISNLKSDDEELPKPTLIVVNKIDYAAKELVQPALNGFMKDLQRKLGEHMPPIVFISCLEATQSMDPQQIDPGNIQGFTSELKKVISSMTGIPVGSEELLGVTERQRQLLSACKEHLNLFLLESRNDQASSQDEDIETDIVIAAEHLRSAADCLSRITGRGLASDVEEVLGVVFEKFCVGK